MNKSKMSVLMKACRPYYQNLTQEDFKRFDHATIKIAEAFAVNANEQLEMMLSNMHERLYKLTLDDSNALTKKDIEFGVCQTLCLLMAQALHEMHAALRVSMLVPMLEDPDGPYNDALVEFASDLVCDVDDDVATGVVALSKEAQAKEKK